MKRKKMGNGVDQVGEITKKFEKAVKDLRADKKWTIADFLRLFIALIIPAGMIFSQYYFWADLSSFARANLQLLIGFMEIVTGLTLWGLLSIFFAYRADRMKLPKVRYDILSRQINTEQKIKALEKKATKWELLDLLRTLGLFISIEGLVALFIDNVVLPYIPEYTAIVIPIIIGLGIFIWLVIGFKKEKKEKCAAEIAVLQQYL